MTDNTNTAPTVSVSQEELETFLKEAEEFLTMDADGRYIFRCVESKFRLNVKSLPPALLLKIQQDHYKDEPEPPMLEQPEGSGRWFANNDDPDYLRKVNKWNGQWQQKVIDTSITLCAKIDFQPESEMALDDQEWSDDLIFLDEDLKDILEQPRHRKLWWFRNVILRNELDLSRFIALVQKGLGPSEVNVVKN